MGDFSTSFFSMVRNVSHWTKYGDHVSPETFQQKSSLLLMKVRSKTKFSLQSSVSHLKEAGIILPKAPGILTSAYHSMMCLHVGGLNQVGRSILGNVILPNAGNEWQY